MRPGFFSLALLVLTACTPMQWVRDGNVPPTEALEKDSTACRQQAWREAQYRAFAYRPYGPVMFRGPSGRSYVGWPYSPYSYPFGDVLFDEMRLADFCMRAKGYELVPVPQKPAPAG